MKLTLKEIKVKLMNVDFTEEEKEQSLKHLTNSFTPINLNNLKQKAEKFAHHKGYEKYFQMLCIAIIEVIQFEQSENGENIRKALKLKPLTDELVF